jgi:nicotinate-nucleotide adenylyltransferase
LARRSIIRASDLEQRLGTVYTADTLRQMVGRFPRHRFIWLMGEDTVAQFHQWKDWRRLARTVPIAVLSRPGYDGQARTARVSGWLRRFVRPEAHARDWTRWSAPAIVFLALPPDRTSATLLRAADPFWHERFVCNTSAPLRVTPSADNRRDLGRHP